MIRLSLRARTLALLTFGFSPCAALMWICIAESQANESQKMLQAELQGKCAQCHKPFVDEWSISRHAKSYVGANYQNAAKATMMRDQQCDGCHAPGLVQVTGLAKMPTFRGSASVPDRGVMCICCHMDQNGVMHGPFGGQTDFHKTVKDDRYKKNIALCVACHGQTMGAGPDYDQGTPFAIYAQKAKGSACQDCHMPPVMRGASTETNAPMRECGEHSWKAAYDEKAMLKSAAILEISVAGTAATATVENLTGHMMPGGAWRQAILEIAANNQIVKREVFARSAGGNADTRLKSTEKKIIRATVPAGANVVARLWWKPMPDTPDSQRVMMAQATP